MTPSLPDRDVVRSKLRVIGESLDALADLGTVTASRLRDEPITRAAVERLLTRVVDQAVDVNSHLASARLGRAPGDYRESFALARDARAIEDDLCDELVRSVGMRNVIVHEYLRLDLGVVADAIPLAIAQYRRYISSIATFLLALDDQKPESG